MFSVTSNGVITVDTSVIKADVEQAYTAALGGGLNFETSTVEGQLVASDVAFLTQAQADIVATANLSGILQATGIALDTIAETFGYYRKQGTATLVVLTLTGLTGTVIKEGSLFSDSNSNTYSTLNDVTISETGSVLVQAQCTNIGAIVCKAGTVTEIVKTQAGLDSVNNAYDGIVGNVQEGDNSFRNRIVANWLNIRARTILGSIEDNIAALPNVVSVKMLENPTSETAIIQGITMSAHSIYACVLGGAGNDIARILAYNKTLGADMIGDTNVYYISGSQTQPYTIQRPTQVNVKAQIIYSSNAYTPAGITNIIRDQLIDWLNDNPLKIGVIVSDSLLYSAFINFPYADILTIKIALSSETDWSDYVAIGVDQYGHVDTSNITFVEV